MHRPLLLLLLIALVGCGEPAPQAPDAYLNGALDWIGARAVMLDRVDWPSVRAEALALAPQPRTTADTYPAIRHALQQLNDAGDRNAFMVAPSERLDNPKQLGFHALYPSGTVTYVEPGGPAELAGMRTGDTILAVNGEPIAPMTSGSDIDIDYFVDSLQVTFQSAAGGTPRDVTIVSAAFGYEGRPSGRQLDHNGASLGYLELPWDWGSRPYPTLAQRALRDADTPAACGWIVDLRRHYGGNLWTFLAAVGPLLGEGDLGGFVYRDGRREPWTYRNGMVFWDGQQRDESFVEGERFRPARELAPIAMLVSPATVQAAEALVVAFRGRPDTRFFGEPTSGLPVLADHTQLSDGAEIFVSGAFTFDRTGRIYDAPIIPDVAVTIDWTNFGDDDDPVIRAAAEWLSTQPSCSQS